MSSVKRIDLIPAIKNHGLNNPNLCDILLNECFPTASTDIEYAIIKFIHKLKVKFNSSKNAKHYDRLLSNEIEWLNKDLLAIKVIQKVGRPEKSWNDSGNYHFI